MNQEKSNSHKFDPKKLNLIEFTITRESIIQPEYFSKESLSEYSSKIGVAVAFNIVDKLIRLEYDIELNTNSENDVEAQASFSVVFIYEYEDFSKVIKIVDKQVKVSSQLGAIIFSISHSTMRGVLLMKLANTVMGDFILPIADPAMDKYMTKK